MNLLQNIRMEDLPAEQQLIAAEIGMEAYIKLVKMYGGCSIYIATQDFIDAAIRNKALFEQHLQGVSAKELAKKFKISYRHVFYLISKMEEQLWKEKTQP